MKIKANFDEARQTQLPAVELLLAMGYEYIPIEEALRERREDERNVILRDIARTKLMEINCYSIGGEVFQFSPAEVDAVIEELEDIPFEGLAQSAQKIYQMIMPTSGGKTIEVRKGDSRSFRYIDFERPENNAFHVTVEFGIQGKQARRPDIVCFVNGIPFAVIELKKSSVEVNEAINQFKRNQNVDEAPKLFTYAQLLIASNGGELRYGTTGTPQEQFAVWKEKSGTSVEDEQYVQDKHLTELIAKPISIGIYETLLSDLGRENAHHERVANRAVTPQDRGILSLLEPKRLLDLSKHFILFDGGKKKVARYQQYFAIGKMRARINELEESDTGMRRRGGIVWHTQGSGKSLTMVMFVKALIEDVSIKNPRVIIVTDRRDLDRQIKGTFLNCGLKKDVVQATTGAHLLELIREKSLDVVTTLVHKFEKVADKRADFVDTDENIFVLIDEAHRTQGGMASLEMTRVIPNACYIAFTGTPLLAKEKAKERTSEGRFGSFIDRYTIDDAVTDGNVLPLIYEGRYVPLTQDAEKIDREAGYVMERALRQYDAGGQVPPEKKLNAVGKQELINNAGRLAKIVLDVERHYITNLKGSGLKAQLVAPSKYAAVVMQKIFEEHKEIKTAVVISDQDGKSDEDDYQIKEVEQYLAKLKGENGDLEKYEKHVIDSFTDDPDGFEILIVVSKLLTGFDAPRNTILYLAKSLRDHDLLQAIARVNRLCGDGERAKTAGYIIDYSENAENIKDAMRLFGNYDEEDVKGAVINTTDKVHELQSSYAVLHDVFKGVQGSGDPEAYLRLLSSEDARKDFSSKLSRFIDLFGECLAQKDFASQFDDIDLYKSELKKFLEMRKTAQLRYGGSVDLKQYRYALRKILDRYVDAEEVEVLTREIDIRTLAGYEDMKKSLDEISDTKEQAEAIATQINRVLTERTNEDPEYFKKLSERVEEIIQALREGRLADLLAIQQLEEVQKAAIDKKADDVPESVQVEKGADTFYRNLLPFVESQDGISLENRARFALSVYAVLKREAVRDFQSNIEVQKRMKNALDDFLYDGMDEAWGVQLNDAERREIIDRMIELAKHNHTLFS